MNRKPKKKNTITEAAALNDDRKSLWFIQASDKDGEIQWTERMYGTVHQANVVAAVFAFKGAHNVLVLRSSCRDVQFPDSSLDYESSLSHEPLKNHYPIAL